MKRRSSLDGNPTSQAVAIAVFLNTTASGKIYAAEGHKSASGVYPANLCPLSCGVEFAGLGEDFGQAVGEPIEAASRRAVRQGSPEHLDGVLSEQ